jgi:hypothetical protein
MELQNKGNIMVWVNVVALLSWLGAKSLCVHEKRKAKHTYFLDKRPSIFCVFRNHFVVIQNTQIFR